MPIDTIKCQECGSADVTEFKPGSYVCGHCESVFKHTPSSSLAVGCEVDGCGVLASGRCLKCQSAFCGSHGTNASCTNCLSKARVRANGKPVTICERCGCDFIDEQIRYDTNYSGMICMKCRYSSAADWNRAYPAN
jgi:hypothetical protein